MLSTEISHPDVLTAAESTGNAVSIQFEIARWKQEISIACNLLLHLCVNVLFNTCTVWFSLLFLYQNYFYLVNWVTNISVGLRIPINFFILWKLTNLVWLSMFVSIHSGYLYYQYPVSTAKITTLLRKTV